MKNINNIKISETIKKLFNNDNKLRLIGILTILVFCWLILYFIPEIFISLFHTYLGVLILLLTTLLIGIHNYTYGVFTGIILIILYQFSHFRREGFSWSKQSTQDFLLIQNSINPNIIFDVNMIQENQANQEELDYFNTHGMWPWSNEVIQLYTEAVQRNPIIRTYSGDSINYARSVYNQSAILRILSYQTKEGQMLLNGVLVENKNGNKMEDLPSGFGDFGYNSGLIGHLNKDIIKCNLYKDTNPTLERITYTGKDGIFQQQTKKITSVDYNDLENIIPGFKFLNEPCDPCGALNFNPNYSCKYKLETKEDHSISSVWKYLWGLTF